jgi:hypothetical protein
VNEQDQPGFEEPAFDDPSFDDPAFDELRALLADARATEPVPEDVVARLDATLTSLQAPHTTQVSPDAEPTTEVVVPLRSRLRHGAGRVLVAAAVLAVVGAGGVGIAQLAGDSPGNAGSTADRAASADRAQSGGAGSTTAGAVPEATASEKRSPRAADGARAVPALTSADFAADAAGVMVDLAHPEQTTDLPEGLAGTGATPGPTDSSGQLDSRSPVSGYAAAQPPPVTTSPQHATKSLEALDSCTGPDVPDAVTVPATLDGALVALVFRPPTDSAQRVEAWSCDGATLLESATVPTAPVE